MSNFRASVTQQADIMDRHYIVNYETVLRDHQDINKSGIDFLILDEAQRAKKQYSYHIQPDYPQLSRVVISSRWMRILPSNLFVDIRKGQRRDLTRQRKEPGSYHPLLVIVSEMKLLYHKWFMSGSVYTPNGIVEFLKEVQSSLPQNIAAKKFPI